MIQYRIWYAVTIVQRWCIVFSDLSRCWNQSTVFSYMTSLPTWGRVALLLLFQIEYSIKFFFIVGKNCSLFLSRDTNQIKCINDRYLANVYSTNHTFRFINVLCVCVAHPDKLRIDFKVCRAEGSRAVYVFVNLLHLRLKISCFMCIHVMHV